MQAQEQRRPAQIEEPQRRAVRERALARHRRPDRVAAGDPAPDVALVPLNDPEGPPVRPQALAEATGRPVVLIFGSYT